MSIKTSALRLEPRWHTPCMAKLERLDWIDAFAVVGYGVRIGVRVSDAALIPALVKRLPPGAQLSKGGRVNRMISVIAGGSERRGSYKYHMAYADHIVVGRSRDAEHIFEAYDSHLRMALAQFSRRKLFIHAGVVSWNGRAIIFPGNSLFGKTHLTAALIAAGAEYLSDEYAVIDEDLRVHPFAKPLSIRAMPTARQRETPAESLGARIGKTALPIGLIVMTRYRAGARWTPRQLSPAVGALQLMKHTIAARMDPARTVDMLSRIAASAPILRSNRPDAELVRQDIFRRASAPSGIAQVG